MICLLEPTDNTTGTRFASWVVLATTPNKLANHALIIRRWHLIFVLALAPAIGRTGGLTEKQKVIAKRIYDVKCSKCHRIYPPTEYAPEEWRLWAGKMAKKAKLDSAREELLLRYLELLRKEQSAPKAAQATGKPT